MQVITTISILYGHYWEDRSKQKKGSETLQLSYSYLFCLTEFMVLLLIFTLHNDQLITFSQDYITLWILQILPSIYFPLLSEAVSINLVWLIQNIHKNILYETQCYILNLNLLNLTFRVSFL